MKLSNFLLLLCTGAIMATTSCLKDKGYDEGKYGIVSTDYPAVSFPQSTTAIISKGLNSSTSAQTISTDLSVEASGPATADIGVTIAADTAGFAASGLTALPTSAYSFSTTQTIQAGKNIATVVVTFPNTTGLNPLLRYGLALTITSVNSGYKISTNMKRVVFSFSIKNKYDGVYQLTLGLSGWAAYGIASNVSAVYPASIALVTSGPNSVTINALAPSTFGDIQPGWAGSDGTITGYTGFGAAGPKYFFDLTTNKVTSVANTYADDGRGRTFYLDPASTTSQWTESSKQVKVEYFLKQTGRPDQKITATYAYLRVR